MKKYLLTITLLCYFFSISNAQILNPIIAFQENPKSYCMHICSDDKAYYTVNGGIPTAGKISVYSLRGEFKKSYPLTLDMRSIMYNPRNKSLYVNTTDKKIFKIIDIKAGTYELVFADLYKNKQVSLALGPRGKRLYAFYNGTLSIYNFKKGKLIRTLSGLKCGKGTRKGSSTVAVDRKNRIYTWDTDSKNVYVYDKEGTFKKSFTLRDGDFGHSLSFANNMIFVSHTKKERTGKWYGYKLWGE